jgi:hypothetical protein
MLMNASVWGGGIAVNKPANTIPFYSGTNLVTDTNYGSFVNK